MFHMAAVTRNSRGVETGGPRPYAGWWRPFLSSRQWRELQARATPTHPRPL